MLKLTGSAHQKLIQEITKEQKSDDEVLYVRLTMGIGWGGPKLKLSLEERPLTDDKEFEIEGIKILIHEKDLVYFDHAKLDYVSDLLGNKHFKLLKI